MDMTRLILLYGVWIAAGLIVAGVAVMVFSGRRHKWFVPRSVLGWFGALGGFILFGIGVFSLALFVLVDVGGKGDALRAMERARGARAPALSFARLDGTPATLAELEGRVVLVNFWATWCPPCVEEMAVLDELQQGIQLAQTRLYQFSRGDLATCGQQQFIQHIFIPFIQSLNKLFISIL